MPDTPTYPGVYIEEIPNNIRTIVGVATSIAAFIGRTPCGPTNDPTTILSFSEFERQFDDLNQEYPLGYAVRDFYQNGGSQALIVRLTASTATRATLTLKAGDEMLLLEAVSEGSWGNALGAHVDYEAINNKAAHRYKPLIPSELFNLTLRDIKTNKIERFPCVTVVPNQPRSVDLVLLNDSSLAHVKGALPGTRPDKTDDVLELKKLYKLPHNRNATADASEEAGEKLKLLHQPFNPSQEWRYVKVAIQERGVDGGNLTPDDIVFGKDHQGNNQGLYALNKADLFNLVCIPPDSVDGTIDHKIWQVAMKYCADHRAMLIVDPPATWGTEQDTAVANAKAGLDAMGLLGVETRNAMLFFPRVKQADPTRDGQLDIFVPCGIIAGIIARTDKQRGVWKAPAGANTVINGIQGLQVNLNNEENGMLNTLGINCLRVFPSYGLVVWGARTLRGADQLADEYKYIPVRRLALFIEESLYRGLKWVIFEPNDESLWAQIRLAVGPFMYNLFRQGAFQGSTPRDAYFIKCDHETTTQTDINLGIVNILIGFAPAKPADFVIIKLQQIAGQIQA